MASAVASSTRNMSGAWGCAVRQTSTASHVHRPGQCVGLPSADAISAGGGNRSGLRHRPHDRRLLIGGCSGRPKSGARISFW
jgi:hypothetical protein